MTAWLDDARAPWVALLVIFFVAIAIRVIVQESSDNLKRLEVIGAFASITRWADRNHYTILIRQQVSASPFHKDEKKPLVFRVVVRDQQGEKRWGWALCGSSFEVIWADHESVFPPSSSVVSPSPRNDPLWDLELDT